MKQQTPSASIYPDLEAAPRLAQDYRLQEISGLKEYLEKEQDGRAQLYKKYHCGVNVLDGVS